MQFEIEKRGLHGFDLRPVYTQIDRDTIIGSAEWVDSKGARQERYQVLTIRDGKIADMQTCASKRQATRFARRVRPASS